MHRQADLVLHCEQSNLCPCFTTHSRLRRRPSYRRRWPTCYWQSSYFPFSNTGGLSKPFFPPQSLSQFARHTSVDGTLLPTGRPSDNYGQRSLSINLALILLYANSVYSMQCSIKFAAFQALSIPVHIRVDNITYSFIGDAGLVNGSVNLTNVVISPTQTKLTAKAGPMQCNLTFLNPIEVQTKSCGRKFIFCSRFHSSLEIGSSNQSHSHTCH